MKDLVKKDSGEVSAFDPTELFDAEANMEGTKPRLPKISIVHQGQIFKVGIDEKTESEITGYIIDSNLVNAYWNKSFQETGGGDTPVCSSMNGIKPHHGDQIQSTLCATCTKMQYGSGFNGKGSACKNMRRVHIFIEGSAIPYRLTMTYSSLKRWDDYMMLLAQKPLNYWLAKTKITLEKAKSSDGIDFSKLKFEFIEPINEEMYKKVMSLRNTMKNQMRGESIDVEEYEPNKDDVKNVEVQADPF